MDESIEYFKYLDSWTNRHFKSPDKKTVTNVRRSEVKYPTGSSLFSQIEINRLIPNK